MKSFKDKFVQTLKNLSSPGPFNPDKAKKKSKKKEVDAAALEATVAEAITAEDAKLNQTQKQDTKGVVVKNKSEKRKLSLARKRRNLLKKRKKAARRKKWNKMSGKKSAVRNEQRRHK